MKISARGLNSNEVYCCSKNDIKLAFQNADISVYFGSLKRHSFDDATFHKPDNLYRKKLGIQGRIIACLSFNHRIRLNFFSSPPTLNLYVINSKEYNDDAKKSFLEEALPKLLEFYKKHSQN